MANSGTRERLLGEEVLLSALIYLVLGGLAIPAGLLYAAALAAGYQRLPMLVLVLSLTIPCAWYLRPHIERWFLKHVLGIETQSAEATIWIDIPREITVKRRGDRMKSTEAAQRDDFQVEWRSIPLVHLTNSSASGPTSADSTEYLPGASVADKPNLMQSFAQPR